eukprot:10162461-Alexandrium_andersonii.AAC.1
MREAVPQRPLSRTPESHRALRPRPMSFGRHTEQHLLAELVAVVAARLAEKPLERCPAVVAHEVLCEELPGVLGKPEHDWVVHWDIPLVPLGSTP